MKPTQTTKSSTTQPLPPSSSPSQPKPQSGGHIKSATVNYGPTVFDNLTNFTLSSNPSFDNFKEHSKETGKEILSAVGSQVADAVVPGYSLIGEVVVEHILNPDASMVDSVATVAGTGVSMYLTGGKVELRNHVVTPEQCQTNVNLFGNSDGLQSSTTSRYGFDLSPTLPIISMGKVGAGVEHSQNTYQDRQSTADLGYVSAGFGKTFAMSAGFGTQTTVYNSKETTNPDGSTTVASRTTLDVVAAASASVSDRGARAELFSQNLQNQTITKTFNKNGDPLEIRPAENGVESVEERESCILSYDDYAKSDEYLSDEYQFPLQTRHQTTTERGSYNYQTQSFLENPDGSHTDSVRLDTGNFKDLQEISSETSTQIFPTVVEWSSVQFKPGEEREKSGTYAAVNVVMNKDTNLNRLEWETGSHQSTTHGMVHQLHEEGHFAFTETSKIESLGIQTSEARIGTGTKTRVQNGTAQIINEALNESSSYHLHTEQSKAQSGKDELDGNLPQYFQRTEVEVGKTNRSSLNRQIQSKHEEGQYTFKQSSNFSSASLGVHIIENRIGSGCKTRDQNGPDHLPHEASNEFASYHRHTTQDKPEVERDSQNDFHLDRFHREEDEYGVSTSSSFNGITQRKHEEGNYTVHQISEFRDKNTSALIMDNLDGRGANIRDQIGPNQPVITSNLERGDITRTILSEDHSELFFHRNEKIQVEIYQGKYDVSKMTSDGAVMWSQTSFNWDTTTQSIQLEKHENLLFGTTKYIELTRDQVSGAELLKRENLTDWHLSKHSQAGLESAAFSAVDQAIFSLVSKNGKLELTAVVKGASISGANAFVSSVAGTKLADAGMSHMVPVIAASLAIVQSTIDGKLDGEAVVRIAFQTSVNAVLQEGLPIPVTYSHKVFQYNGQLFGSKIYAGTTTRDSLDVSIPYVPFVKAGAHFQSSTFYYRKDGFDVKKDEYGTGYHLSAGSAFDVSVGLMNGREGSIAPKVTIDEEKNLKKTETWNRKYSGQLTLGVTAGNRHGAVNLPAWKSTKTTITEYEHNDGTNLRERVTGLVKLAKKGSYFSDQNLTAPTNLSEHHKVVVDAKITPNNKTFRLEEDRKLREEKEVEKKYLGFSEDETVRWYVDGIATEVKSEMKDYTTEEGCNRSHLHQNIEISEYEDYIGRKKNGHTKSHHKPGEEREEHLKKKGKLDIFVETKSDGSAFSTRNKDSNPTTLADGTVVTHSRAEADLVRVTDDLKEHIGKKKPPKETKTVSMIGTAIDTTTSLKPETMSGDGTLVLNETNIHKDFISYEDTLEKTKNGKKSSVTKYDHGQNRKDEIVETEDQKILDKRRSDGRSFYSSSVNANSNLQDQTGGLIQQGDKLEVNVHVESDQTTNHNVISGGKTTTSFKQIHIGTFQAVKMGPESAPTKGVRNGTDVSVQQLSYDITDGVVSSVIKEDENGPANKFGEKGTEMNATSITHVDDKVHTPEGGGFFPERNIGHSGTTDAQGTRTHSIVELALSVTDRTSQTKDLVNQDTGERVENPTLRSPIQHVIENGIRVDSHIDQMAEKTSDDGKIKIKETNSHTDFHAYQDILSETQGQITKYEHGEKRTQNHVESEDRKIVDKTKADGTVFYSASVDASQTLQEQSRGLIQAGDKMDVNIYVESEQTINNKVIATDTTTTSFKEIHIGSFQAVTMGPESAPTDGVMRGTDVSIKNVSYDITDGVVFSVIKDDAKGTANKFGEKGTEMNATSITHVDNKVYTPKDHFFHERKLADNSETKADGTIHNESIVELAQIITDRTSQTTDLANKETGERLKDPVSQGPLQQMIEDGVRAESKSDQNPESTSEDGSIKVRTTNTHTDFIAYQDILSEEKDGQKTQYEHGEKRTQKHVDSKDQKIVNKTRTDGKSFYSASIDASKTVEDQTNGLVKEGDKLDVNIYVESDQTTVTKETATDATMTSFNEVHIGSFLAVKFGPENQATTGEVFGTKVSVKDVNYDITAGVVSSVIKDDPNGSASKFGEKDTHMNATSITHVDDRAYTPEDGQQFQDKTIESSTSTDLVTDTSHSHSVTERPTSFTQRTSNAKELPNKETGERLTDPTWQGPNQQIIENGMRVAVDSNTAQAPKSVCLRDYENTTQIKTEVYQKTSKATYEDGNTGLDAAKLSDGVTKSELYSVVTIETKKEAGFFIDKTTVKTITQSSDLNYKGPTNEEVQVPSGFLEVLTEKFQDKFIGRKNGGGSSSSSSPPQSLNGGCAGGDMTSAPQPSLNEVGGGDLTPTPQSSTSSTPPQSSDGTTTEPTSDKKALPVTNEKTKTEQGLAAPAQAALGSVVGTITGILLRDNSAIKHEKEEIKKLKDNYEEKRKNYGENDEEVKKLKKEITTRERELRSIYIKDVKDIGVSAVEGFASACVKGALENDKATELAQNLGMAAVGVVADVARSSSAIAAAWKPRDENGMERSLVRRIAATGGEITKTSTKAYLVSTKGFNASAGAIGCAVEIGSEIVSTAYDIFCPNKNITQIATHEKLLQCSYNCMRIGSRWLGGMAASAVAEAAVVAFATPFIATGITGTALMVVASSPAFVAGSWLVDKSWGLVKSGFQPSAKSMHEKLLKKYSLPANATMDDITRVYRKQCLLHHPDKNGGKDTGFLAMKVDFDNIIEYRKLLKIVTDQEAKQLKNTFYIHSLFARMMAWWNRQKVPKHKRADVKLLTAAGFTSKEAKLLSDTVGQVGPDKDYLYLS